ncbi:replication protein-like protein A 70 kDa DNA-binding subunit [Pleomassaria siparia CBS 279.74]|uniref:Replication protein A subunit n=1 Tax=Pleomassaria siparia CBS 279.74 TaxID=1314801 RepID=A0A6G1KFP2_9PLEO|nr:replication protein-like protein A 70 kDa DNA-binding subunit [Pleomassaria siparia CBS 279.74]
MAEQAINQGSIRSIFEPESPFTDRPVVQCVQIKTMEPKAGDALRVQRFRVVLSDIRNYIQTMIATDSNDIVTSGKLKKGSIVRLLKFGPQVVKDKKILIIMKMEVLDEYGELEKIGCPEPLDLKDEVKQQPASISGDQFYGNKPVQQQAPPQQQQRTVPVHQRNPGTPAHPHLYPIEALSPYGNKWTIRARCTHKGEIKTWNNAKSSGKLFSVNLLDDTGEIRATGFTDACDKFYDLFEEGTVYYISSCEVKIANKKFSTLTNDYELTFKNDSEVEKAEDQDNKPQVRYNFTKIGDLGSIEKDTTIDTLGVLKNAGEVNTIQSKSTNKDFNKRELLLADDTQTSVRLTIWGNQAETFDVPEGAIIAFKGVKVSDFGGKSLSLLSSGSMTVDPDIDEAHKLRGWFDAVGQNAQFNTHASTFTGGSGQDATKTIAQIIEEEAYLQSDSASYFNIKASITYVKNTSTSTLAYPACSTPKCNKKVTENEPNLWWCEKCQMNSPKPQWRYILSIMVADHTGSIWLSSFDEPGQMIIGMPANDLIAMQDQANEDDNKNNTGFHEAVNNATCKMFNFKVRAKMEMYQDQPKPRYQIQSLHSLNFAQEANKLAQILKQYDVNSDSLFVN